MWIGELPEKYSVDLKNTAVNLFSGVEQTQKLPWEYRWFKCDGDRWITFVVASLVPILITWGLAVSAKSIDIVASYVVIAIGQICVLTHVLGGRRMVSKHRKAFSDTLKDTLKIVVDKLETTRSDEQTREFPYSRPTSPQAGSVIGSAPSPGDMQRPGRLFDPP